MLNHVFSPFLPAQQLPALLLLNAHQPWHQAPLQVFYALVLNVGKRRPFQIPNHVWRHPEDCGNLAALVFSRVQKLRVLLAHAQCLEFRAAFQNRNSVGVLQSPVHGGKFIL